VACYVVVFRHLDLPWGWVAFYCGNLGLLAFAQRWPALGLGAYAGMLYGTPRYTSRFEQLAASNALHVVVAVCLVAAILSRREQRAVRRSPLLYVGAAAAAWICLVALLPRSSGLPALEAVRHSPVYLLHAAVLFGVAVAIMDRASATLALVLPLCFGLVVRAFAQGLSGIRFEGDIGPLAAMTLPFCILLGRMGPSVIGRIGATVLAVGALVLAALTYNRATAVAFGATFLVLAWQFRRHVWLLMFVVLAMLAGAGWLANSPYAHRFERAWAELSGQRRGSVSERLELWRAGRALIAASPIWGVGVGHYTSQVAIHAPKLKGKEAHNSYVHVAVETGLPGLVLYISLFLGGVIVAGVLIRNHPDDPIGPTAAALQASLAAYLTAGFFISRHDMVFAYILVGWIVSLQTRGQGRLGEPVASSRRPEVPLSAQDGATASGP
jgi:O-antigen ligase